MSVSIKKIPGVKSVNVSLKQGLVSIALTPGNTVTMAQIRKAIRDDAFTPKEAHVTVEGDLARENGKLQFKVAGTNETFPIASTPHQSWQKFVGHEVTIDGLLAAPAKGAEGGSLQIISATPVSAVK